MNNYKEVINVKRVLSFVLVMIVVLGVSVSAFAYDEESRGFLTNQVQIRIKKTDSNFINNRLMAHGEEKHDQIEEKEETEEQESNEQEKKDTDSKIENETEEYGNQIAEEFKLTRTWIIVTGIIGFILFLVNGIFYYWWKRSDNLNELWRIYFKKILNYHCFIGILGLIVIGFVHIIPQFHGVFFSSGWIALVLYSIVILLGIVKKYFEIRVSYKVFRILHAIISIVAFLLTVYHILDKLYII